VPKRNPQKQARLSPPSLFFYKNEGRLKRDEKDMYINDILLAFAPAHADGKGR
jgi:hypothetical protein